MPYVPRDFPTPSPRISPHFLASAACAACVLLALLSVPGLAQAARAGGDQASRTLSPYVFLEGALPEDVENFPLEATRVQANISGVIAEVTVSQVYQNRGAHPLHARYVFPGSTRAAVSGMRFQIGDRMVTARIKERSQAATEFAEAKAAGKSASLLDQERPNVFTMSLANIMPGDRVEVELRYSELLVPEEGTYQFVYPTVVGPRYAGSQASQADSSWVKSPYLPAGAPSAALVDIQVNVSTGMPLAALRSPSHQPEIAWDDPSLARVSLRGDAGNRDFILDYRLAAGAVEGGLLLYQGQTENFFLLTVQPPARVLASDIPPREYIFVLDVSGSMAGFPLDTAKTLMKRLLAGLGPKDSFNVILFAGGSHVLAPQSLPATSQNVSSALATLDREQGGGGTELEAALRTALKLPRGAEVSRSVVVVTDGYIEAERSAFALIAENLHETNVFTFGIGSSVNRYLIEGLARAGQGEAFVVTGPGEAAAAADRLRRYIATPVLTGIQIRYEGFEVYDVEPQVQPDLFAERPLVVFGKWRGDRKGRIQVVGRTGSATFDKSFPVEASPPRPEHGALPLLWARTRIARLSDLNFQGEGESSVQEVTRLGLAYSLLTPYTSFIAVLEAIRNPGLPARSVDQPLPMPAGVSDLAVGGGYGSGAEPGLGLLLLGAGVLAFVTLRRRSVA
ncbi:MAG: VIT and VWA domain-containing protein [Myxococcales bacterium]|nr:VIT and VWA domain-containing protein [Myxococcales bacterium]